MTEDSVPIFPDQASECTRSFNSLIRESQNNIGSFNFLLDLMTRLDHFTTEAASILRDIPGEADRDRYVKQAQRKDPALNHFRDRYARITSRNLVNNAVSAIQKYISDILKEACKAQPRILSSQTVSLEDLLAFEDREELISYVVGRKINDLSYGGLNDIERYYRDRLGLELFEDGYQRQCLSTFIELRNVNVHNAGVIDHRFLQKTQQIEGLPSFEIGYVYTIGWEEFTLLANNAMKIAMRVDDEAANKFNLRRASHEAWERERALET